ncbi:MAG: amino acid ABC transporter permease [Desulfobacterales bacterium]|nr:amino acid ABC transporter permease [Desulfobacterales bacterium]
MPPLKTKKSLTPLDALLAVLFVGMGLYLLYRVNIGLNYKWSWSTIPQYLFRYDPQQERWLPNLLMQGFFTTIRLSFWGTILATLLGTMMGLFRLSHRLFRRLVGGAYVELSRNLPPLVLIFLFYFFISDQIMPVLSVEDFFQARSESTKTILSFLFAPAEQFPTFLSALVTLAVFEGAYITEIVRAGIQSIEKGQWEVSSALGFSRKAQLRHIILPQAVQRILPPLAGQFISTIKDSAIVSVISIQELTFQGIELMSATYLTFEVWITITLLYLSLTLSLSLAIGRLEMYMKHRGAG